MAQWLVVTLRGPLASFADAPGNAVRKSGDMPTRSALLGLAGAALGIRRDDGVGQHRLAASLVTAAAVLKPDSVLIDYHTFQSLNKSAKGARTRADVFSKANRSHLETSLTRRGYRADGLWQGAYRLRAGVTDFNLADLENAFRQPVFFLSLGRRSCPISHPLDPKLVVADDVRLAFKEQRLGLPEPSKAIAPFYPLAFSLEDPADAPGAPVLEERRRRDDPRDRSIRWLFDDRAEWRVTGEAGEAQHD